MKYKVGDKVRVRNDLKNGKRYGNNSVGDDMTSLCGKEVEIAAVLTGGYKVNGNFWTWTDEMFEERRRVEVEEKYINDLVVKIETLEKEIKELKGEELFPCPFCGGKAIWWETEEETYPYQIVCRECNCGTDECDNKQETIDYWIVS